MKKLTYLLMLAIIATGFYGCEKEVEIKEELTIKAGVLDLLKNFSKEESFKNLEFKASHAWEITGTADWITIAPKTGAAGDAVVKISVTANTTHADREAKITIALGTTIKEEITIVQKQTDIIIGKDGPNELDTKGGTFYIPVEHNVDLNVVIKEGGDWITYIPKTKALEETDVQFDYTENVKRQRKVYRLGII